MHALRTMRPTRRNLAPFAPLLGIALTGLSTLQAQNFVLNGSFEDPGALSNDGGTVLWMASMRSPSGRPRSPHGP